ncbi:hypothetical protein LguiB_032288 [Lonicera macranthoides]
MFPSLITNSTPTLIQTITRVPNHTIPSKKAQNSKEGHQNSRWGGGRLDPMSLHPW